MAKQSVIPDVVVKNKNSAIPLENTFHDFDSNRFRESLIKSDQNFEELYDQLAKSLTESINVLDYGAVRNGSVDTRASLQTALDSAVGRWVIIPAGDYRIDSSLVLPSGTRIFAYGARIFNITTHVSLLEVSGEATIFGLELEGAGFSPQDDQGVGIYMVGSVGSYLENLILKDCYIHDVGFYGVYTQFVKNIFVENCKIHNLGYAGFAGLSVSNAYINNTHVKGIDSPIDGYGITFTRATITDNLTVNPRSKDCRVENCLIEDNIGWKGLDTHGGENITFINNTVLNCRQGIGIVSAGDFAPKSCRVIGNRIKTTRGLDVSANDAYGVAVSGVTNDPDISSSLDPASNCVVMGNLLEGCGKEFVPNSYALGFRDTENLIVSNNVVYQPLVNGIVARNTNFNFQIVNNLVEDPNSSSVDAEIITRGIRVQSQYNEGVIEGNGLRLNNPSLNTKVAERGVDVGIATNNKLIIRSNQNNFTLPTNIPLDVNIVTDEIFNKAITINKTPSSSNVQALLNEGFIIYADNDGGQNVSDPVSLWLSGRVGTTVYISPRSGQFNWVGINAETVDINGKLRIAQTNTLEPTGVTLDIDGTPNSGNVLKNGIHYTTISAGNDNNYPANSGLSFVIKSENSRVLEFFANTTGTLWYRFLTTSGDPAVWNQISIGGGSTSFDLYFEAQGEPVTRLKALLPLTYGETDEDDIPSKAGVRTIIPEEVSEPDLDQFIEGSDGRYRISKLHVTPSSAIVDFTTWGKIGATNLPVYDTFSFNEASIIEANADQLKTWVILGSFNAVPTIISSPPAFLSGNITGSILTGYANLNRLVFELVMIDAVPKVNLVITQWAGANADPSAPSGQLFDDIVLRLDFEDNMSPVPATLVDSGPNALTVNLTNEAGDLESVVGQSGQAIKRGVIDAYSGARLTIPYNAAMAVINQSSGLYMGLWLKLSSTTTSKRMRLISTAINWDGTGWRIDSNDTGQISFYLNPTTVSDPSANVRLITSVPNGFLFDDTRHFYEFSYDHVAKTAYIHRDRVLMASVVIENVDTTAKDLTATDEWRIFHTSSGASSICEADTLIIASRFITTEERQAHFDLN